MFSAEVIALVFVGMFLAIFLSDFFEKRQLAALSTCAMVACSFAAIYCLAAGSLLAFDWLNPLEQATAEQISHASGTHGGKGGVFLAIIRFWPFVLIGLSGYVGYMGIRISWRNLKGR